MSHKQQMRCFVSKRSLNGGSSDVHVPPPFATNPTQSLEALESWTEKVQI